MSGITFNEDCNHFFFTRGPEKMTIEGLHELVDHYAGPQVKEMIFNVNAMRVGYQSKVFATMWDGLDPNQGPDQPLLATWYDKASRPRILQSLLNAKMLHDKGIDPYAVWVARARELGREAWVSMRMNDIHFVDHPDGWTVSPYWRQHPELWRFSNRMENWMDRAFDYGKREVYDYHMALAKEIFERYDMDAFELDWMRFAYHFRPGHEAEGVRILNAFQTEVRQLANDWAKRRGHAIKIAVRVPSQPQTSRGLGMDAVGWARKGLVDFIAIGPLDTTEFDLPIEQWKELLEGTGVLLGAVIDMNIRPHHRLWEYKHEYVVTPPDMAAGAAASFLHRGADRIYLFNFQDSLDPNEPNWKGFRQGIERVGDLTTATSGSRRHQVSFTDVWAPGEPPAYLLPTTCRKGKTAAFRIPIGPAPMSGTSQVYLGLGERGILDTDAMEVRVNGTLCTPSKLPMPGPFHSVLKKTTGFDIPPTVLQDGYNVVEVTGTLDQEQELVWVEIMIRP